MERSKSDGIDTYTLDPVYVTFIGCRGCGKTSLMVSMFNEVQKNRLSRVTADLPTMQILSESNAQMLRLIDDYEINDTVFLAERDTFSTEFSNDFKFTGTAVLGTITNPKRFRYPFVFTDLPGSWYFGAAESYVGEVKKFLGRSTVCLLTIDAPALMSGGYTNHVYNRYDVTLNWLKESLVTLKNKNVRVVFVLSRCERFVQDDTLRQVLFEKVRRSYAPLIDVLRTAGIDICGTWVETLGGVQFLEYRRNAEGIKVPVFQKTGDYAPRNCELPLLLTLQKTAESMKRALVEKRGPLRVLLDWLGFSHYDLAIKGLEMMLKELEAGLSRVKDNAMFEL